MSLLKFSAAIVLILSNKINSFTTRMSSVTSVPSVVHTATSTNQYMMMSFITTGLCVAVTQCSAQTSVELSLSGRSLMTM